MSEAPIRLLWREPVPDDPLPCAAQFGVFVLQVRPLRRGDDGSPYEWRMVEGGGAFKSGIAPTRVEAQQAAEAALADRYGFEAL